MAAGNLEIILDAEVAEHLMAFRHRSDAERADRLRPKTRDRTPVDENPTHYDRQRTRDPEHQAALAGPVRTEERRDLAARKRDVHVVKDGLAAACKIDALDLEPLVHASSSTTPR
ncbi:hypothetical protein ACQ3JU_0670 (plasmid) [Bradyrhizobium guangxiense]